MIRCIFILSVRVGREDTDLPERHLCCTSSSLVPPDLRHLKSSLPGIRVSRVPSLTKTRFFPLLLMLCLSLATSLSLYLRGTWDKNHQCGWRKRRGCEETDYSRETKISGGATWWIERRGGIADAKQVRCHPMISFLLCLRLFVSGQTM